MRKAGNYVYISDMERLIIQTMIVMEIKNNKEVKEMGIEPCFETADLKKLYRKLAKHEYKEWG